MLTLDNLRDRLRHDSRDLHDLVDRCYSQFDLATEAGLAAFLAAQLGVLGAIRLGPGPGRDEAAGMIEAQSMAIRGDLAALGRTPPDPFPPGPPVQPQAALYVLLGSRLGTQLLRRTWEGSDSPAVRAAGAYLTLDPMTARWRGYCREMAARPGTGPAADALLRDVRALFQLYWRGAEATSEAHA